MQLTQEEQKLGTPHSHTEPHLPRETQLCGSAAMAFFLRPWLYCSWMLFAGKVLDVGGVLVLNSC